MRSHIFLTAFLLSLVVTAPGLCGETAEAKEKGTIFTLWPLVDYRESPRDGYRNLSILGPLIKLQQQKDDHVVAVRPLLYATSNTKDDTTSAQYLYPVASSESSPEVTTMQVLKLFQKNIFRKDEGARREESTMLFPFYISGNSENYGPYTSIFPFYGDIYERFWRDEYHYVLFPLYGRTVNDGTTTTNLLYPFFSTTTGIQESGFHFWPLYGQAAKEGVYARRFVLWPFYLREKSGMDTDNPTSKHYLLPLFAATDSPKTSSRYYLWPFFGHKTEVDGNQEEWDYFWPLLRSVRGDKRNVTSVLPFYLSDERKDTSKNWYMWPLLKQEEIRSDTFCLERDRVVYFLYSDTRESWPKDGATRRRTAFWPLFLYNRDTRGVRSLSLPALLEPILDREGIERNWAPLWRVYQHKWRDDGDSAASFLWNLYWHERRGEDLAYELFPLIEFRSQKTTSDLKLLKGLIRYENSEDGKSLRLFWLPFGVHWGEPGQGRVAASPVGTGSEL